MMALSGRMHHAADFSKSPGNLDSTGDLEKIKAKLLVIYFADDQINSPEFAVLDREIPRVKNGRYVIVPAGAASDGEGNNTDAKLWRSLLEELLRSLTH